MIRYLWGRSNKSSLTCYPQCILYNPNTTRAVVCRPVNDTTWGLTWPPTAPNSTSSQPCPGGPSVVAGEKPTYECHVKIMLHSGQAVRVCTPDGEWSNTNVTQCSSYAFMNLKNQVGINLEICRFSYRTNLKMYSISIKCWNF